MLIVVFSLILISGTALASSYKSEVGVGLIYGNSSKNSVTVSAANGLNVYNAQTGELLHTAAAGEEFTISMWSTGFSAYQRFDGADMPKISVQPAGGNIKLNGIEYRGYIYLERRTDGTLLVINYVGTDDYVSSVLGKEMSYTWPKEALKAQAVCARNFVLCRGSAHKEYGFDVCSTTHCQVYGGVASEHQNTRQAVNETKGILATYNGQVVPLYFFATSAGQTEDVKNVWGSTSGYLKSVPDTYEKPDKASKYSWTVTYTRSELESKIKANGVNVGTLQRISIDSVTESGRVTQMTFYGTSGSKTVKLEKCRTVLGLYSQKFTIKTSGVSALMTTSGTASAPLYACTANGIAPVAGYSVLYGNGTGGWINVSPSASQTYVIEGGGYGHGVGMSQWGARGMAESGFTYDAILKHYFTGIELG